MSNHTYNVLDHKHYNLYTKKKENETLITNGGHLVYDIVPLPDIPCIILDDIFEILDEAKWVLSHEIMAHRIYDVITYINVGITVRRVKQKQSYHNNTILKYDEIVIDIEDEYLTVSRADSLQSSYTISFMNYSKELLKSRSELVFEEMWRNEYI